MTPPLRSTASALLPSDGWDRATLALIAALTVLVVVTFGDYAVSNDEVLQHRYGELILDYYRSGLTNRAVFGFDNLYLYGGLFDIAAVALAHAIPIETYDLRHILCALTGIGGIAATAAAARLVAGPRAGLIAAASLAVCGPWYGAMFNHTKDIPFAAAVMAALFILIRIGHRMSSPRPADIAALGLFAGAALGLRSLGLLLAIHVGFAVILYLPWSGGAAARVRMAAAAAMRLAPAAGLAYLVMILAWPWAALAPLNPVRGLLAFSDYHYPIRTYFAGRIYQMSDVPRAFVSVYLLIRVPLLMLAGAAMAVGAALTRPLRNGIDLQRKDVALLSLAVAFPLACQAIFHGPAFTGMRHFLFVVPPLAVLAGIGLDRALAAAGPRRMVASGAAAAVGACLLWDAGVLVRLHPYENLSYNPLVGGLAGAYGRYDLDYWFNSMPEAIRRLEAHVRATAPPGEVQPAQLYSVAVCGERASFERTVTLPQLRWDFKSEWNESEFFIAPTHMNCDRDLDGEVVATVERFGVPIAQVKDRRALTTRPVATVERSATTPFD
ncbi:MAG: hypothetical protein P4M07_15790 [Xanthobacteraceae bacterium]|nr:hypothetical protein [Xanthobacteraceae bacterium]